MSFLGQYFQAVTTIGAGVLLNMPIDVDVTYNNTYQRGHSDTVDIDVKLPADQARFMALKSTRIRLPVPWRPNG